MTDEASRLVGQLGLQPHPEGGFYRETYRSTVIVDTPRGSRSACTAIYFMLETGQFSALHRIHSDEVWHFYAGVPIRISAILSAGQPETWLIGPDCPQCVVPARAWFGAEVAGDGWSLVGCTVAPGFDFADFELADRSTLLAVFPHHSGLIMRLTR